MKKNPQERLGYNNSFEEVKSHPYFYDVDWAKILRKEFQSPLLPDQQKSYFDSQFVKKVDQSEIEKMQEPSSK